MQFLNTKPHELKSTRSASAFRLVDSFSAEPTDTNPFRLQLRRGRQEKFSRLEWGYFFCNFFVSRGYPWTQSQ